MDKSFGWRLRSTRDESPPWPDLTNLPNQKMAFIYQRLSTHEQMKRSIYSLKSQDALIDLAKEDGYAEDQIHVENRDLGISGTKGREDRPGLAYLVECVEAGLVESVYVVHISRIYRDQTLINAFALGELLKQSNVIIVTPHMRLNLQDKMHMRLFRMEVERAADELEVMAQRLLGPKNMKAKAGYYAGESIPPGYIIDERKQLADGTANPGYHTYQIYEPHAQVVRTIFNQLATPGMTATRVARYCKKNGITLLAFPPEFDTKSHRKNFIRSKPDHAGNWKITVSRVRSIATNPAYIGWKIWQGEVVSKDCFDPIVDEDLFWTVQKRFEEGSRPKKSYDPLPLAGLVYCGDHDVPRQMIYSNNQRVSSCVYHCNEAELRKTCIYITANILDTPVGEAVISQIALPGLAQQVLDKLTDEYKQAKEQAASYRREVKRLETEIDNLRNNMVFEALSKQQITWIDQQVQHRLDRIKELADLEKQPIGAFSKTLADPDDIALVESYLNNLPETWPQQPNGLKNAFLRLLLDKVVVYDQGATTRVKLFWRVGLEQEILIYKPFDRNSRRNWSESELDILKKYYVSGSMDTLQEMLPNRSWTAIKNKAKQMNLQRIRQHKRSCKNYTAAEDELVRQYYRGNFSIEEITQLLGREIESVWYRGRVLGLTKPKSATGWEWISMGSVSEKEGSSRLPIRKPAP